MSHKSSYNCSLYWLLISCLLALTSSQYYTQYNPYYSPSPTFSSLNQYYYQTTPYTYYSTYATASPYDNTKIRIWPYVIGQYLYPVYNNNNYNNPYASLSNPNWQSYYSNVYQSNWGRK